MVIARRRSVLVRVWDESKHAGLFGPIAAFLLGLVERLIGCLDQVCWRVVPAGDRTGEACADGDTATL